jgi:hypothetical protein
VNKIVTRGDYFVISFLYKNYSTLNTPYYLLLSNFNDTLSIKELNLPIWNNKFKNVWNNNKVINYINEVNSPTNNIKIINHVDKDIEL